MWNAIRVNKKLSQTLIKSGENELTLWETHSPEVRNISFVVDTCQYKWRLLYQFDRKIFAE